MLATIASRIAFVVLGYFAGIASGSAAFPCVLAIISAFVPDSALWDWLGLGPVAMVAAPILFLFVMWITVVMTFIPAAIANLLTEAFAIRNVYVHILIAIGLAVSAGLIIDPTWFAMMGTDRMLITFAAFCGAVVGGLVYWAIAGRNAGFRSPPVRTGNIAH
ncbi:MAG: hypothetical protein U1E67_14640 [Hyphomicrobiales bacterium]